MMCYVYVKNITSEEIFIDCIEMKKNGYDVPYTITMTLEQLMLFLTVDNSQIKEHTFYMFVFEINTIFLP